jgi:hypothetical protein
MSAPGSAPAGGAVGLSPKFGRGCNPNSVRPARGGALPRPVVGHGGLQSCMCREDGHDVRHPPRHQGRRAAGRRRPPPPARGGHRSPLCRASVLRPARLRPGQVRAAAARARRRAAGQPCRGGLRAVPPRLLPSASGVRAGRPGGAPTPAARPPGRAHAARGGGRLPGPGPVGRAGPPAAGPGRTGPGPVRPAPAPAHHRPPPGAAAGGTGPAPTAAAAEPSARYEAVRAHALGEPASGVPAHGLALIYRFGLPAWLAADAAAPPGSACPPPPAGAPARPPAPLLREELAVVLAGLAWGRLREDPR